MIGILAACAATEIPAARGDPAAPDLRFGLMTHFAQGWDPSWIQPVAAAHIATVRDEIYWDSVEPRRGTFAFPPADDAFMAGLKREGISPLVVLDFANPGYDRGQTPWTEAGIAAYARYAAAVLQHYGPQIQAVEIWNEYNGTFCTGPAASHRAATYLRMLRAAYAEIKRVRPDVTVVGGATAGSPLPYWTELLEGGVLDCLDVVSVHPYRYDGPPEGLEDDINGLRQLMRRIGGRAKPVWVTEIGWDTRGSQVSGGHAVDDATLARYLVRAYALLLSAGVERVYWYELRDEKDGPAMGLVRSDAARTPKPAYRALASLVRQLDGARCVRREPSAEGIYSILFQRPSGEQVRVLWALQPALIAASGSIAITDLAGRRVDAGAELNLSDSPLFVTGDFSGLPPAPPQTETVLADSRRDFSSMQGANGWYYGSHRGPAGLGFSPLPSYAVTDWSAEWKGELPFISVSDRDQHPSVAGSVPVAAVRRWVSTRAGEVHVTGSFHCGTQGDGVGVSVLVDGRPLFRELLGGGRHPVERKFDFVQQVGPGTAIDFAVDPGPGNDISYDVTDFSATIRSTQEEHF